MGIMLRNAIASWCVLFASLIVTAEVAHGQNTANASTPECAETVAKLVGAFAKQTGRKFLVDPRADVCAARLVGQNLESLRYADLLALLDISGFTAVEEGDSIHVIPHSIVRQQPLPLITGSQSRPDAQYVDKVILVKNVPAAQLVPLLRPLLPQQAHLVAFPCTNMLMIADTFGNVARIEKLVQAMDTGAPYTPRKCSSPEETVKPGS
jgi:general secretion pathway protein D